MLLDDGKDGSFLVRPSQHHPGDFTLCVRRRQEIAHFRIQTRGGGYYERLHYGKEKFVTLSELVQFHTENPGLLRKTNKTANDELKPQPLLCEKVDTPERWYHGGLSRSDADLLLTEKGQDGSYLVRTSAHSPGHFVLSIREGVKILHFLINQDDMLFDIGGRPQFCSLSDLVEYYKNNPPANARGQTVLKYPFLSTLPSEIAKSKSELNSKLEQMQQEKRGSLGCKDEVLLMNHSKNVDHTSEVRLVRFKIADEAVTEMKQAITNHSSSSELDDLPPFWQPQRKNETLKLFAVYQGTLEYRHVELKFFSTMTKENVIKCIERIQNKWLWKRYVQHRSMMDEKNNGAVNEMELFHGTRTTDPQKIYNSEEGFDMRYSSKGMWGVANYFAVNASYSHNYAHNDKSGQMKIFLVKVLTGDSFECSSDCSLRMPPFKSSAKGVQLGQVHYDTVTGITKGCRVYMTYDNQKAYPAYLITYMQKPLS